MINSEYKIVKLVSGENIICEVTDHGAHYEICNPLLMNVIPRMRRDGLSESLALTRWVQPFTEQKYFEIEKSKIILTANASAGLSVYYEKCLQAHDEWIHEEPTHEELEEIEQEEYSELLEELDNSEYKVYH
jgi:DNA-binding transcriptional MocR family regulator